MTRSRPVTVKTLRDQAERASAAGDTVALDPDQLLRLLSSQEAALLLADAVAALRSAELGNAGRTGAAGSERASASELRNRWRRLSEENGLKVDAALKAFRAATGDAPTIHS